jgi:hypothetical protein
VNDFATQAFAAGDYDAVHTKTDMVRPLLPDLAAMLRRQAAEGHFGACVASADLPCALAEYDALQSLPSAESSADELAARVVPLVDAEFQRQARTAKTSSNPRDKRSALEQALVLAARYVALADKEPKPSTEDLRRLLTRAQDEVARLEEREAEAAANEKARLEREEKRRQEQAAREAAEEQRRHEREAARSYGGYSSGGKHCTKGCPCGDTCISCSKTCRK